MRVISSSRPADASTGNRRLWAALVVVAATSSGLVVSARAFTSEQATRGAEVFRLHCARCHAPDAAGKDAAWRGLRAPELVGVDSLPTEPRAYQQIRRQPFRSAR